MPRPKTHDDALRVKLLDRAGELVAEEGPRGLSLRRLASEVGTSTTAVYSLFGSKPALLSELRADGFRRLGDQLRATAPTGDPIADLVRLGTEYRAFALTQRHLYPIMFGDPGTPGGAPAEDDIAGPVLAPLREAVRAAVATGALPRVPDDMVAGSVWAYAHGMVSFELGRALPDGFEYCRAYERGLRATVTGWAGSPHTAPY